MNLNRESLKIIEKLYLVHLDQVKERRVFDFPRLPEDVIYTILNYIMRKNKLHLYAICCRVCWYFNDYLVSCYHSLRLLDSGLFGNRGYPQTSCYYSYNIFRFPCSNLVVKVINYLCNQGSNTYNEVKYFRNRDNDQVDPNNYDLMATPYHISLRFKTSFNINSVFYLNPTNIDISKVETFTNGHYHIIYSLVMGYIYHNDSNEQHPSDQGYYELGHRFPKVYTHRIVVNITYCSKRGFWTSKAKVADPTNHYLDISCVECSNGIYEECDIYNNILFEGRLVPRCAFYDIYMPPRKMPIQCTNMNLATVSMYELLKSDFEYCIPTCQPLDFMLMRYYLHAVELQLMRFNDRVVERIMKGQPSLFKKVTKAYRSHPGINVHCESGLLGLVGVYELLNHVHVNYWFLEIILSICISIDDRTLYDLWVRDSCEFNLRVPLHRDGFIKNCRKCICNPKYYSGDLSKEIFDTSKSLMVNVGYSQEPFFPCKERSQVMCFRLYSTIREDFRLRGIIQDSAHGS